MWSEDYAASFQEYFDAYYEEILKYCYIHLGYNQTHAQECCQEVFLLCLQKQPAFPTPDGLKVWLYRTAKFQVKKMLRNLQTEQARLDYYQERPEGAEAGAFRLSARSGRRAGTAHRGRTAEGSCARQAEHAGA